MANSLNVKKIKIKKNQMNEEKNKGKNANFYVFNSF